LYVIVSSSADCVHLCPLTLIVSIYVHLLALSEQFQELAAEKYGVNVRKVDASTVGVFLGEAITEKDVEALLGVKRWGLGAVRVP